MHEVHTDTATVSVHYCSSHSTFMCVFFRCRIWVENCRRADLEAKTSDQLNKHYRLCAKHFDPAMVCKTVSISPESNVPGSMFPLISQKCESSKNVLFEFIAFQSPYRTVLKDTAIPTIFDLTSHLKNPHTRHRKRIKELVRKILMSSIALNAHLKLDSLSDFCKFTS